MFYYLVFIFINCKTLCNNIGFSIPHLHKPELLRIWILTRWSSSYVLDETDHVWTEVYSFAQKRWLHCDPCENACDTPLVYESGWKKQLSYIIAYSAEEVQDVSWRYSSRHGELLARRNKCTELELVEALMKLREERQKSLSEARRRYLTNRLLAELVELMHEKYLFWTRSVWKQYIVFKTFLDSQTITTNRVDVLVPWHGVWREERRKQMKTFRLLHGKSVKMSLWSDILPP